MTDVGQPLKKKKKSRLTHSLLNEIVYKKIDYTLSEIRSLDLGRAIEHLGSKTIEHLWDELEITLLRQPNRLSSQPAFTSAVMGACKSITMDIHRNFVSSLFGRVQAVVNAKQT